MRSHPRVTGSSTVISRSHEDWRHGNPAYLPPTGVRPDAFGSAAPGLREPSAPGPAISAELRLVLSSVISPLGRPHASVSGSDPSRPLTCSRNRPDTCACRAGGTHALPRIGASAPARMTLAFLIRAAQAGRSESTEACASVVALSSSSARCSSPARSTILPCPRRCCGTFERRSGPARSTAPREVLRLGLAERRRRRLAVQVLGGNRAPIGTGL